MLRILVVDVERNNMLLIESLLQAYKRIEIIGKLSDFAQAMTRIQEGGVDAVWVDIEKPIMNGLAALKQMKSINPGLDIVIVTAYDQYAVEAFELNAVDYILKPLTRERLDNTIARLFWRHKARLHERAAAEQQISSSFHCFGQFRWSVSGHDDETIKWKRLKDRELMAYLVHHRNEFVPKETILEDLWPDASPKHSTAYLYTCVYHIRKMLRCMDCTETLESRNNSYRLRLEQSWCDADLMDTAAGWDIHAGNIEECERIVSLYSGGYMGSEEFRWAKKLQEKYEKDYVQLNNRMAAFYAGHGNPDQAAICLSRAHNRRIGTC